ncbi:MAG: hypothetical protein M9899_07125 [Bdellovibrionaceae bacterium]|nr:hypothetical protein [Pseudobdellovibrionaceae bacterium]
MSPIVFAATENTKNSLPVVYDGGIKQGPTCAPKMAQRFSTSAEEYKGMEVHRLAMTDLALPKDDQETVELDCYGVLLVSGSTHEKAELPFTMKTADGALDQIKCFDEKPLNKTVSQVLGKYRRSCFYAMPLNILTEKNMLFADWSRNRTNQIIVHYPLEEPIYKFNCKPKHKPKVSAFKKILQREYCISI